ncbi:AAA family ATPase [Clostridium magnum]|uniref:ATPase AAA-type core domain-containing protein n=1 Tax=Clostridium magnum DSM 2767 TaxID=1121326 RepID=A0A161YGT4_9CLOT|nr:AAA family ATPase [Clostridium magnum]KZL89402.1 hypothetical protein CLMAG_53060 [Clostridium magnum DSM 2767]SHI20638.1 AAA domain-containing protein, putative AbiEii toxin, Type IV TA system [Clostridium magnum DSM 2767]
MELIYVYVNKFRNIEKQEFKFSNKFNIFFNNVNGNLEISKNNDYFDMFKYDKKICNFTVIVGRNGVGKTNLLDVIGEFKNMHTRIENKDDSYFLIYLYSNDRFVVEAININLFSECFDNSFNTFCCSFMIIDNKFCNFNIIHRNDEFIDNKFDYKAEEYCCVYFSRNSREASDTRNPNFSNWLGLELNSPFFKYAFLYRQSFTNYNNNFFAIYSFLNHIGDSNYFEANLHPTVCLVLGNSFKHHNAQGYVAKSIKDIPDNEFKKLTNKQKFILNILYYLNLVFAFEFIDNSKEEWDDVLIAKNEKVKIDYSQNLFKSYIKYYLEIYSSLVNESRRLIIKEYKTHEHDNQRRGDFIEHYNDMAYYVSNSDTYAKMANLLNEIYKSLEGIEDKFFVDEIRLCVIDKDWTELSENYIVKNNIENVLNLLDDAQVVPLWNYIGTIHLDIQNISEGEKHLINLIGGLWNFNKSDGVKEIIFLFDEPDLSLHPEWNRRFINDMIGMISSISTLKKYQIIITTHSPFVLSDLPRENIIALKSDEKGKCQVEKIKNNTFANHIHTLLSQDFFMDSTIGEYARKKINEIINYINSTHLTNRNQANIDKEKINYYFGIINHIGDELLRKKLINMFVNNEDYSIRRKAIEMQIKNLQDELKIINFNGEDYDTDN